MVKEPLLHSEIASSFFDAMMDLAKAGGGILEAFAIWGSLAFSLYHGFITHDRLFSMLWFISYLLLIIAGEVRGLHRWMLRRPRT
jgi:hypothetical protein